MCTSAASWLCECDGRRSEREGGKPWPIHLEEEGVQDQERIRFSSVDGWDEDGGQAWVSGGGERLADVSILPIGVLGIHRQKRVPLSPPNIILSQSPGEHCSHDRARIPLHLNDGSVSCSPRDKSFHWLVQPGFLPSNLQTKRLINTPISRNRNNVKEETSPAEYISRPFSSQLTVTLTTATGDTPPAIVYTVSSGSDWVAGTSATDILAEE